MAGLHLNVVNLSRRVAIGFSTLLSVALLLIAALVILLAPIPQLIIHVRWNLQQLDLLGIFILSFGVLSLLALIFGFMRRRAAFHQVGIVLWALPIIGIALHRFWTTGEWEDIGLLAAFLVSTFMIYGALYVAELDAA